MILGNKLECFHCFQEFSKKGFPWFPPFRETKCHLWQTFGKHWHVCKPEVFHFYILFLLGFMSGLAGGQGSRFMSLGGKGAVHAYALTYLVYSLLFFSSLSSDLFVCLFVCIEQIVSFSYLLVSLFCLLRVPHLLLRLAPFCSILALCSAAGCSVG